MRAANDSSRRRARGWADSDVLSYAHAINDLIAVALAARAELDRVLAAPEPALDCLMPAARAAAETFEAAWSRLRFAVVPPCAEACDGALQAWLETQLGACRLLGQAAAWRSPVLIEQARAILREGDGHARAYNQSRRQIVEQLAA